MFKTTVNVEGMMCPNCERHANEVITSAINPKKVTSSHKEKKTEILSEEKPSEDVIKTAIESCGYKVTGITSEEVAEKKLFGLF